MTPLFALASLSLLGYHLTFDAEMTSPSDMSQFINTFVNGDTTLYNNHEAENYMPFAPASTNSPFSFVNGALVITAAPTTVGNLPYASGILETAGIFSQSGGYFEIRAATPAAPGFWPAFWLLPMSYYPEIDILEQPNNSGTTTEYWTHTSTPTDSSGGFTDTGVNVTQGYHTYGFLWTPTSIQYVFDGQLVGWQHDLPPAMVGTQMYLIANLAVGGPTSWPGVPPAGATSTYSIDYIRAYSNDPTVPAVSQEPMSSPDGVNTLPVLTPPVPPPMAPVGTGLGCLMLQMSEDSFEGGDAQFTVSVDGQQRGGVMTVTASHAFGQTQAFPLKGNYGTSKHVVTVNFLNDASGSDGDRNLYVTSATINGMAIQSAVLTELRNGPQSFNFTAKPLQPITIGTGPDVLAFNISDVPQTLNARYIILVDGVAQGSAQVATALHNYGQTQPVSVFGNFGPAAHTVSVSFTNGALPAATTDPVDLYVDALSYNGIGVPMAAQGFSKRGTYQITTPAQQADTLTLALTEDAWQGDAQAEISVDGQVVGIATITAPNWGTPQTLSYSGNWGGAAVSHSVRVNFLNDSYAGPGQDRNLHVQGVTVDGSTLTSQPQALMRSGPVDFGYTPPVPTAGWVQSSSKVIR